MDTCEHEEWFLADSLEYAKEAAKYTTKLLLIGLPSMALWIERDFVSGLGSFVGLFSGLGLIVGSLALFASYIAFNVLGFHATPLLIALLPCVYRSPSRFLLFALWASNPLVLWYFVSDVTINVATFVRYLDWHGYFALKMCAVGIVAFVCAKRWVVDYAATNLEPLQPYILIVPISLFVGLWISPDDGDGRITSGLAERVVYYLGTVLSGSCGYWLGAFAKRFSPRRIR